VAAAADVEPERDDADDGQVPVEVELVEGVREPFGGQDPALQVVLPEEAKSLLDINEVVGAFDGGVGVRRCDAAQEIVESQRYGDERGLGEIEAAEPEPPGLA